MSKNKLQRFAELKTFSNVMEPAEVELGFKFNWSKHFGNNNPITLELACGKGEYALALAKLFPKRNFIGIDIKGARLWKGAKTALENKLTNVAFLRIQIEDLEKYFIPLSLTKGEAGRGSVSEIWITFPDPFPRKRQLNKRLTSPRFLAMYKKILVLNGTLNLKTDDLNLFNYSVETAIAEGWKIKEVINNIYAISPLLLSLSQESKDCINSILQIQTFYENKHLKLGKQIHYLKIQN